MQPSSTNRRLHQLLLEFVLTKLHLVVLFVQITAKIGKDIVLVYPSREQFHLIFKIDEY